MLDKLLLTLDDCVKATGICRLTIAQRIQEQRIHAVREGGRTLIRRKDLEAFIDALVDSEQAADARSARSREGDGLEIVLPARRRDRERWTRIWEKARVMDRTRYTITGMVLALRKQLPDLAGLSEDTLRKIVRAGQAGMLD